MPAELKVCACRNATFLHGHGPGTKLDNRRKGLLAFCLCTKGLLYALGAGHYGYLSDELYFLDAAAHLAVGYVDFPPLIAWLAAAIDAVAGHSLWALRLLPAVAGFGVTWLAVELTRILGGRIFAQWVTAICVLLAPGFVSIQSIFTMNVFDQLWWASAFWLTALYLETDDRRAMWALGAVLGAGLLTKLSILALCVALPAGFALWYPRVLLRPEFRAAVAITALLALPFGLWQWVHDFPFLQFVAAYGGEPPQALVLQNPAVGLLITMSPLFALVWAPGAVIALLSADRRLRLLGTVAWLCIAVFVLAGVKFYFAVPVFIVFIVAGALAAERVLRGRAFGRTVLLIALLSGVAAVPTAAPVLPIGSLQRIADFIRDGQQGHPGTEPARLEPLFPHFAEMHGWPELVAVTTRVWTGLSPEARADTTLFAAYYGQAGALNQLDRDDRLPDAYSGHMSYDLWNNTADLDRVLFIGFEPAELAGLYGQVEHLATLHCRYCMSRENGAQLLLASDPRVAPGVIRERLRRYYFF